MNRRREILVKAAQVRSGFTMLTGLLAYPVSFGCLWLLALIGAPGFVAFPVFILLVFGLPLAVSWHLTERYCKPAVVCPHCGETLWACGSGNFKPRRMKVRYDAHSCPQCGARIV